MSLLLVADTVLASVPTSVWITLSLAAGIGVAVLRRRAPSKPIAQLWAAVGKSPEDLESTSGDAWTDVAHEVERLRESAWRADRLLLKTNVLAAQHQITTDVLAALQDGILVLDQSEQILLANAMARRVLGLGDRQNLTLEQAQANCELLDGIRSVLGADLARTVTRRRIEWLHEDQRLVFVLRGLVPDAQTTPHGTQIILLEDLTAEERAARAKSEFIYGVSHELKTPLTAIQASLELVNDHPELPQEDRTKLIHSSYVESVRLSQMVAELLDLARVEAGITQFKRERVAMAELLAWLREFHQPLAQRKSIGLRWEVSDYLADLVGDPGLLRQAFVNIIGNAIKYTKSGGEVFLSAGLEGSDLVVRVRDTGIGIAKEDLPRLFEKFFRAANAQQSRIQGTGLGLPMARYIIERHMGRIEVSSEIGVGSEFAVFLQARTVDAEETESRLVAVDGGGS